jgi:hypothetical protein
MLAKELERMAVYGSLWQSMAVYGSNGSMHVESIDMWRCMAKPWQSKCRRKHAPGWHQNASGMWGTSFIVSANVSAKCVSVNAASPPLQGYISRGLYQNVGYIFWNQPLNCLKCQIGPWTSPRWHFCGDGGPPQKQIEQLTFGISSKKCDGSGCP